MTSAQLLTAISALVAIKPLRVEGFPSDTDLLSETARQWRTLFGGHYAVQAGRALFWNDAQDVALRFPARTLGVSASTAVDHAVLHLSP